MSKAAHWKCIHHDTDWEVYSCENSLSPNYWKEVGSDVPVCEFYAEEPEEER